MSEYNFVCFWTSVKVIELFALVSGMTNQVLATLLLGAAIGYNSTSRQAMGMSKRPSSISFRPERFSEPLRI